METQIKIMRLQAHIEELLQTVSYGDAKEIAESIARSYALTHEQHEAMLKDSVAYHTVS